MGAVNYGSSDYISIGLNVSRDFEEWEIEEIENDIETLLNEYNFYYFHVVIKPGYYEGFYIDIENNFPVAFNWYEEKQDAQKEITQIKRFLLGCVSLGLVQYFPGWCTGYSTETETKAAINTAIKAMRQDVKTTPTWKQYTA